MIRGDKRQWAVLIAAVAPLLLASGCSRQARPTYAERYQGELAVERAKFIQEQRNRLDVIDQRIGLIEQRLEQSRPNISPKQHAELSQRLFDLKTERQTVEAELARAEDATPEEWAQMRGTVGRLVDSLQAGVGSLWGWTTSTVSGVGSAVGEAVTPEPSY